ncbi:hypothetical protein [Lacisediminihabitans sp.]|uniref:hypothetical protein n=1 Tax=Lacisediminihabitans sp. TaxID=2787631 RepID=UPI00374DA216
MSEPRMLRRPPLLVLLAVVILLECALLVAATVYLVVELHTARADSVASAVAILVLTALAAVWLGVMAVHTLLGRSWIRGGAVVWQVLQIAVAIGSFQGGYFSRADIGWWLILPAVLVLVLLFTPSVIAATRRTEQG